MQLTLASGGPPALDTTFQRAQRTQLSAKAWLEVVPSWLSGSTALFDELHDSMRWRGQRRQMYDRIVDVPRLMARPPDDGPEPVLVARAAAALSRRYGVHFDSRAFALYRDGRDSVAWHGDRLGDLRANSVVAILSVGGRRKFQLRPAGGGRSKTLPLSTGDLVVLGGDAQETWEHTVPKQPWAAPRIAVMFRHSARLS
jgi:alkylated DNA repair dioxygenase AlkB